MEKRYLTPVFQAFLTAVSIGTALLCFSLNTSLTMTVGLLAAAVLTGITLTVNYLRVVKTLGKVEDLNRSLLDKLFEKSGK